MDIKLKKIAIQIIEEIQNDLDNWNTLNELFNLDINNSYKIDEKESSDSYKQFIDQFGIKHVIVSLKNKDGFIEIKAYPLKMDNNGKLIPNFEIPKEYDPKVLNTYINVIINYYMKKYRKILLQPIDRNRHKLFKMCLNKYINKFDWQMISNEKDLYIILLKTDASDLNEYVKNFNKTR